MLVKRLTAILGKNGKVQVLFGKPNIGSGRIEPGVGELGGG
jgi:hypothetical protein